MIRLLMAVPLKKAARPIISTDVMTRTTEAMPKRAKMPNSVAPNPMRINLPETVKPIILTRTLVPMSNPKPYP